MSRPSRWKLVPANVADSLRWSYGTLASRSDLYAPRVFGATSNFRCACGELFGESVVGQLCLKCRVTVEADFQLARRIRLGDMNISARCINPITKVTIFRFPILPIFYRVSGDGSPTILGRKYEELVDINFCIPRIDELRNSDEHPELQLAIDDLFGEFELSLTNEPMCEPKSLVELLFQSIALLRNDVDIVSRALGLAIEFSGVM